MVETDSKPEILPVDPAGVPDEIKALCRFVCWRLEQRDGKWTKPPCRIDGAPASVTNPGDWATWDDALETYSNGRDFSGVGLVLTGDGYGGIDLDRCVDANGNPEPWAAKIIERVKSYTEISPSGRGIRILFKGKLPPGPRRKGRFEMYDSGRYLTLTGRRLPDAPATIEDHSMEVAELHAEIFTQAKPAALAPRAPALPVNLDARLQKARTAANGAKFRELESGGLAGYPSASEGDLAFCGALAFWLDSDAAVIDAAFRASGRMRLKWDERHGGATYGARTIEKALSGDRSIYDPAYKAKTDTRAPRAPLAIETPASLAAMHVTEIGYQIERILPSSDVAVLAGPGCSNKTWLALEIMRAHATGGKLLDTFEVKHPGPAAMFDKESGAARLALRAGKLGIPEGLPLYFVTKEKLSGRYFGPAFNAEILYLFDTLEPRPTFICFDSWTRFSQARENDSAEVAAVYDGLSDLAFRAGAAILVLDHARKSSPQDRSENRDRLRGSVDKYNAVSACFWIERRGEVLTLSEEKPRDFPVLSGPLGLRFGPAEDNPARLCFTLTTAPEKPLTKIETAKARIMESICVAAEGVEQARLFESLANVAGKRTLQDAIGELKSSKLIKVGKNPGGRGNSPVITRCNNAIACD